MGKWFLFLIQAFTGATLIGWASKTPAPIQTWFWVRFCWWPVLFLGLHGSWFKLVFFYQALWMVFSKLLKMIVTIFDVICLWFQTQMSKKFPAPYISTTLMCFLGSIECGLIGLISEHKLSAWSLSSPIRLISAIYAVRFTLLCKFQSNWFDLTMN